MGCPSWMFSALQYFFCEGQRSLVLRRCLPTASLSSSQPKTVRRAVTVTALQPSSLSCLQISFFLSQPKRHASLLPFNGVNGSVTLDRPSRAANDKLAEGVCTALMNSTWPCYSFHSHNSKMRSVTFLNFLNNDYSSS